jgi:threonylcarbamoyladenosine tRNA methylthiotransferase MtaB
MPRVAFYTLGCKLNQYETEAMRRQLETVGYRTVDFPRKADIYVINTCTVTNRSDVRSRQMIRRATRQMGKGLVVVTGCYAQRDAERIREIPGVHLVLGNAEKNRLADILKERQRGGIFVSPVNAHPGFSEMEVSGFAHHTRAFLKIQDGCDGQCTYCVVPSVRGRSRSRSFAILSAQVEHFISAGYKELVLTGVNLGRYRDPHDPHKDLLYLLTWLEDLSGLGRVRLSSIEPTDFSPELIALLKSSQKICRHLHIPMQSGSDDILQAMGRPYRAEDFARLINSLDKSVPGMAIGVDVIVGFPGETEDQYRATRQLLEDLPICRFHVFNFSRREGTPAAVMPDQVPDRVRRRRSQDLRDLSSRKFSDFRRTFLGRQLTVLTEQRRDRHTGMLTGLSDNYIRVLADGPDEQMNDLLSMRIYRVDDDQAWGEPIATREDP